MDSMFQQLKKLYDNELYANVVPIVSKIYCFFQNTIQRRQSFGGQRQNSIILFTIRHA